MVIHLSLASGLASLNLPRGVRDGSGLLSEIPIQPKRATKVNQMTSALYAPRIVCKICGSEENVTAVMDDTYITPMSVMQAFTCNCSECLTAFRFEVKKVNKKIMTHTTQ